MSRIVRRYPAAAAFFTWLAFRLFCGLSLVAICTSVANAQVAETLLAAGKAAEATAKMSDAQLWAWVAIACVAGVVVMAWLVVKVLMAIQQDMAAIKAQTAHISQMLTEKTTVPLSIEPPHKRR